MSFVDPDRVVKINDYGAYLVAKLCAEYDATYVLMHSQGNPKTMQQNPTYQQVINEVDSFFDQKIQVLREEGVKKIILDPGIGFGKNLKHNMSLIRNISIFHSLGFPILVGNSRKRFIKELSGKNDSKFRKTDSLENKILALEADGLNYSNETLNMLLNIINRRNILFYDLDPPITTEKLHLEKTIEYLKSLPEDERYDCQFVGTRAEESRMRMVSVLQRCRTNILKTFVNYPMRAVTPLSFWTMEDTQEYYRRYNIPKNPAYNAHDLERMGCASCPAHKFWEIRLAKDPTNEGFGMLKQNFKILKQTIEDGTENPDRLQESVNVLKRYLKKKESKKLGPHLCCPRCKGGDIGPQC